MVTRKQTNQSSLKIMKDSCAQISHSFRPASSNFLESWVISPIAKLARQRIASRTSGGTDLSEVSVSGYLLYSNGEPSLRLVKCPFFQAKATTPSAPTVPTTAVPV